MMGIFLIGAAFAVLISSVQKSAAQGSQLLKELGNKWGLEYQPSPTLGCPELKGIYKSHHILFQIWPSKAKGDSPVRKRLVVSIEVAFDGIIRICRRNGVSHMDMVGTKPLKTGDPMFDAKFLTSATDHELTRSVLTQEVRGCLTQIQETEVCISSNQVRIYGEGPAITETEVNQWLETAIRIGDRMQVILGGESKKT
ncbi:MAG: hypothetical protein ACE5JA_00580 [bacterium]